MSYAWHPHQHCDAIQPCRSTAQANRQQWPSSSERCKSGQRCFQALAVSLRHESKLGALPAKHARGRDRAHASSRRRSLDDGAFESYHANVTVLVYLYSQCRMSLGPYVLPTCVPWCQGPDDIHTVLKQKPHPRDMMQALVTSPSQRHPDAKIGLETRR